MEPVKNKTNPLFPFMAAGSFIMHFSLLYFYIRIIQESPTLFS